MLQLYRLEKYDECFDIYRGLLKNTEVCKETVSQPRYHETVLQLM